MNDSIIKISQKNNIDDFIITTDQKCKNTKIYTDEEKLNKGNR